MKRKHNSKIPCLCLLLLLICIPISAQNAKTVTGLVLDEKDEPVIGATVKLKGNPSIVTVTDLDGKFSLKVPVRGKTLTFTYVGMLPVDVVIGHSSYLKVHMQDDNIHLNDVVVVGYGQQKKASVLGSITQTTGAVLERSAGVPDVGDALTGNLPGVETMASTGMPGEESPQIVIRGINSWNNSNPLVLVDGIERPINTVDMSSVATVSVLKDASATSIYGVRGADGVILITTKRGEEGKASIDVGFNATMSRPSKLPDKYDAYTALQIRNEAIEHEVGLSPTSWNFMTPQGIIDKYRYPANGAEMERYPNVNWDDVLFKNNAMSYNPNISITGGTRFVRYFANVDFYHEGDLLKKYSNNRGYKPGYGYNRLNGRSNLDFQLTKTTSFKADIFGSYGVEKRPNGLTNEYTVWQGAYSMAPDVFLPRYPSTGYWGYYPKDAVGETNSVEDLALSGSMKNTTTQINTDFTLNQNLDMFLKGLSVQALLSYDNTFIESNRGISDLYNGAQSEWIDPATGLIQLGSPFDANNKFDYQDPLNWSTTGGNVSYVARNIYYSGQLNYANSFGKHNVSGMGLFSRQETTSGSEVSHRRQDEAFRATYNYDNKYFVEYNGTYDGSEQFAKKYRMGFFSSGSIGWMISEENFMKSLSFLDMLKLRASVGDVGDDNISNGQRWLYMDQWAYGDPTNGGSTNMGLNNASSPYGWYSITNLGNTNTHWEKVYKTNIGADYSFLRGMFAGSVDFFRNLRTQILIDGKSRAIASYFGKTPPPANLGKMLTRGYELELRFNKTIDKAHLWANLNMTHTKDKVLQKDDPQLYPDYEKTAGKQLGQTYSYINSGYMNNWDQVYGSPNLSGNDASKLPGDYYIIDYNGDGVVDSYDNVPYGYTGTPLNTYNATIGFEWKGWSGFVQFYGVDDVTRQVVFSDFPNRQDVVYNEGSYWTLTNNNAKVPLPRWITTLSDYSSGKRYFYDGSYIRLKNAEIAYTFTGGWIRRLGFKNLKIYLNGDNLWEWTKMPDDRESNFAGTGWASQGAYPTVKRFNLGVKFSL
jgi:TonB-linked SusC/RagA family outer membrane protein